VWRAGGDRLWPLWLRMTERVRPAHDPAQMRNAITGLNLYRANFVDKLPRPRARHAHAPVQFIVPLRDRYVGPELSLGLEGWLVDAGHWVVLREPARIAACIEGFVSRHRTEHDGPTAAPLNARAAGA
jgi:hypothetical protein